MHYCINAMKTVPNTLICVGFGQEHQHNTMLFIYSRLLSDLFNNIKKNQSFVKLTTSAIKSARRDSSVTSGRPSSIHTRNSQAAEHRDFISTMFPRAYQDLLSYVPGLFSKRDVFISGSINNISQVSDLVSKLSNLISKILNELNRGCRIMFVLDDLQWSDSYSLDLTYQLMQRCPHIFFLFVSRPEEEYKESLKNDLRKIAESENTESLFLGPLDAAGISEMVENGLRGKYPTFKSVDPVIVTDIMEQSQGNALIASSLVVMLKEDSNIGVDMTSGMLVCRTGKMAKNATAGSLAVILAQFDKQPSELKNILRIASVAGQYFNINEVRSILIHRKEAAASTAEEMVQLLLSLDKYKFIKTTDDPAILMFSHFLIQQGIYTSLVPATRIEIHGAFADLYEVGDEVEYSRLIFHLLKVEGQNERKQRVLYAAFLESASALRVKES
ncbi:hypothetical protein BCR33DRAFT_19823 [Rhizoclosmatium globosum]|uniref:Orc1-like AAA ATPase domain-containing protein n=1 Tax=Rhizoclosmatium globosum TaxID=329046 RepID=A0A1Y2CQ36_9FUNG|nr:hypothetical protein BCR33DRAFT_19823 [Rhizoclosmatium globosum]|eukprot:ORY49148.1 hypothetical protein BCR33DRAFT_19823 [Rhizoclosmatium globosum]